MKLVQPLPPGPLDIVGDIHGEYEALLALLQHLGYRPDGQHPQGRTLVFVGDLCDRGPDSPAVIEHVQQLMASGRACAIIGNHEINLLREEAKDGSGWAFARRVERDTPKYAPFTSANTEQLRRYQAFAAQLPVALERSDLRIVHAAWQTTAIDAVRHLPICSLVAHYDTWEAQANALAASGDLADRMRAERAAWGGDLELEKYMPPLLHAHAENDANQQMLNPLKVLTSGVEQAADAPFYAGGKWRFVKRVPWWDHYQDATPVVVGHYWRRRHPIDRASVGKNDEDLFSEIAPTAWHGARGNVFCVDFSVGGSWRARLDGQHPHPSFKLAALRWPERVLQFHDGKCEATEGFGLAPSCEQPVAG
jgi:hypothetical protein